MHVPMEKTGSMGAGLFFSDGPHGSTGRVAFRRLRRAKKLSESRQPALYWPRSAWLDAALARLL